MSQETATADADKTFEKTRQKLGKWGFDQLKQTVKWVASPIGLRPSTRNLSDQLRDFAQSALRRGTDAARISTSPKAAAASLTELRNKAEVSYLVRGNRHSLGIPAEAPVPFPLDTYLEKAYDREDFAALFAVEGLGREFGKSQLILDPNVSGILLEENQPNLPGKSLFMLHAGVGMGFAKHLLDQLPKDHGRPELREAINSFVTLCRSNSRPGYQIAALEPLGLVTRTFHGHLTNDVDKILSEDHPDIRGLFWHGAGRAVYFLAKNSMPCATWDSCLQCEGESVDEETKKQLFAGHAWAFTMTNMRHPEVLLHTFVGPHASDHPFPELFGRGVAAAVVMREDSSPDTDIISQLQEFDSIPESSRTEWDQLVLDPTTQALDELTRTGSAAAWMNNAFSYTESAPDSPTKAS